VTAAKDYFTNVQTKDQKYDPVLAATDKPPIHLNKDLMTILRPGETFRSRTEYRFATR
jgi:aminobenzoyl-glutamate utilization protein B